MAEFDPHSCCYDDLARESDLDLADHLSGIIDEVMIENRVYYDDDDRAKSLRIIYSVIAGTVFNPCFSHLRADEKAIVDLVTYLVTHLA